MSEVERCTNLVQREQYRLLIERYCKTTLAETEKIFCKGDTSDTNNVSRKENEKPPIVVIDDKPISKVFHTKVRQCILLFAASNMNKFKVDQFA